MKIAVASLCYLIVIVIFDILVWCIKSYGANVKLLWFLLLLGMWVVPNIALLVTHRHFLVKCVFKLFQGKC